MKFYFLILTYINTVFSLRRIGILKDKGIDEIRELVEWKKYNITTGDNFNATDHYAVIKRQGNSGFILSNDKEEHQNKLAEIYYYDTLMTKGWNKLSINTFRNDNDSNFLQTYLAGYLEGRITVQDISNFLKNIEENNTKDEKDKITYESVVAFLKKVNENLYKRLNDFYKLSKQDKEYYYEIYTFYTQLHGLHRGFNDQRRVKGEEPVSIERLLMIQADGEIPELMSIYGIMLGYFHYKDINKNIKPGDEDYFSQAFGFGDLGSDTREVPKEDLRRIIMRGRCSALIKLTTDKNGNYTNLIAGHSTWSDYSEMYRTFKQ
jgi:hypothetical protein